MKGTILGHISNSNFNEALVELYLYKNKAAFNKDLLHNQGYINAIREAIGKFIESKIQEERSVGKSSTPVSSPRVSSAPVASTPVTPPLSTKAFEGGEYEVSTLSGISIGHVNITTETTVGGLVQLVRERIASNPSLQEMRDSLPDNHIFISNGREIICGEYVNEDLDKHVSELGLDKTKGLTVSLVSRYNFLPRIQVERISGTEFTVRVTENMLDLPAYLFKAALNWALKAVGTKLDGLHTDDKSQKRRTIKYQIPPETAGAISGTITAAGNLKEKELLEKLGGIIDHADRTEKPTLPVKRYNRLTTNYDEIGHLLPITAFNEYNEIKSGSDISPLETYEEVALYAHCGVDMLHCLLDIFISIHSSFNCWRPITELCMIKVDPSESLQQQIVNTTTYNIFTNLMNKDRVKETTQPTDTQVAKILSNVLPIVRETLQKYPEYSTKKYNVYCKAKDIEQFNSKEKDKIVLGLIDITSQGILESDIRGGKIYLYDAYLIISQTGECLLAVCNPDTAVCYDRISGFF